MDTKCAFIGGRQIGVNCLKQLLDRGAKPELVIGNVKDDGRDTDEYESLVKLAQANDVPTLVGKKVSDSKVIEQIDQIKPVIIFTIGCFQIIPKAILDIPGQGCLNIHPALLPKYRGRFSTAHAIFNDEDYTGVTLHQMDEGIDTGPVIIQQKIKIEDDDTAKTLYDKVLIKGGSALFAKFLDLWLSGEPIKATPQDESQATYYPKGLPNDGQLDWSWDGDKIKRFIRAMTYEPYPPAEFSLGDKKMVIIDKQYFKGFE